MGVLEAVLAVIGLLALVGAAVFWRMLRINAQPLEEDLAAPYREVLHAAIRLQNAAQDAKQQLFAEALRQAEAESDQPRGHAARGTNWTSGSGSHESR